MKINIAATHRFHVLNLAIELQKQGHDVHFYSYVSEKRCCQYGLKSGTCTNLFWIAAPFFVLAKIAPKNYKWQMLVSRIRNFLLDHYLILIMRPCDIFIPIGCVYTHSLTKAKQKWDAITILEWGSKHIIEQLNNFGRTEQYPKKQLQSDLHEYDSADYISIPATHVKESFLKHGVEEQKLLVNPYGVSLTEFPSTECSYKYDIIAVGGWRYEKGSDLLVEVCKKYGYKLLHVGTLVNMDFPSETNFTHHDSVNQSELVNFYKQAKIFVLPSRAEGLSLVQAQAISCGLPVVCSKETGGADLKLLLNNTPYIQVMNEINVESLHQCIENSLHLADRQTGVRNYAHEDIDKLSWEAYGLRYNKNIDRIKHEL